MRLLAVLAHPRPDSFGAALLGAVREGAALGGHEVRAFDLHADGFDPVMGVEELAGYNDPAKVPGALRPHVEALSWAEGLLFIQPTWWGGLPAMSKGWLDRVLRPGLAFHSTSGIGLKPGLTHVRMICEVTTTGAPHWLDLVTNTAGRRTLFRSLKTCTGLRTRTLRLALHGIDDASEDARRVFLTQVRDRVAGLR